MKTIKKKKDIYIEVCEPMIQQSNSLSYMTYKIQGYDLQGQFCIRRRYRQFSLLRQKLVERWLGIYIPPIDSKKLTGNTDEKFVQKRKRFLNYFCQKIAEKPYLFNCHTFQCFIRGDSDFQKSLSNLPNIDYELSIQAYQKQFKKYTEKINSAQIHLNNETDYDFLKKAEKKLEQIRNQFREVVSAHHNYQQHFNLCMNKILPDYEKRYLIEHAQGEQNKLILEKNQKFNNQLNQIKINKSISPFEEYVEMISVQLRQTRALIEAVQQRKQAENKKSKFESKRRDAKQQLQKIQNGKMTLRSVFLPGSKQVQLKELESLIPQCQRNQQCLTQMIILMNAANNEQIKKFKQKRGIIYIKTLLNATKKQMNQLKQYGKLFKIPITSQA